MATATAVELDDETRAGLERLAARRQQGVDVLLREAASQFLQREDARAEFRSAALEAWAHYQATGLHSTGAEVDEWLARLEAGEDAAPPQCHG